MPAQTRRDKAELPLSSLIDLFILSKQIEGRSEKTLTWYRANLASFSGFVTNESPATLRDAGLDEARAFIAQLQGRKTRYESHSLRPQKEGGLSSHTIHGYVRTLKAFGSWLCEEGYTAKHPFDRLKPPKLPETMIEILSDDEIGRIVQSINPDSFLGARLYAIVLVLLDTGIRASELCTLTMDNTFLTEGFLKVRGKGNKERMVPFGALTKKALLKYLHSYRPEAQSDDERGVFLSIEGTPLSYNGLALLIRRLGSNSDVPRLHPHLFRHTFAVRYLMNGGDIMTLRLILGHTTLEVTQMYMHLAEAHVQIQHHKFSPVDRLDLGKRRRR
ncbi:MAG: tyrosine-type recombinase/integrase [Caldilineales bacterium]